MAEETAMSCDSARQVCEKEHVLDYFREYLLSNLLMLCAKLFSLFLKDLNNLKYPPNFCEMGQIVMLLAGLHLALLLTAGQCSRLQDLQVAPPLLEPLEKAGWHISSVLDVLCFQASRGSTFDA